MTREEIKIPEGYEVRIEGNNVIIEQKDGDDEMIRKEIISYIKSSSAISNKKWLAYLEKQKDSDKAQLAVELIDKYIDKHTANAHDMDDSNPDKKYYSGVDDTLSNIAGILISVYSEEKQKEQKSAEKSTMLKKLREHLANTPREQLDAEFEVLKDLTIDKPTENKDVQMCNALWNLLKILYAQDCTVTEVGIQAGDFRDWLESIRNRFESPKEQKPVEWSEFDKGTLEDAICATDMLGNDESFKKGNPNLAKAFRIAKDWLKTLPERFNLQPKQEWSEE